MKLALNGFESLPDPISCQDMLYTFSCISQSTLLYLPELGLKAWVQDIWSGYIFPMTMPWWWFWIAKLVKLICVRWSLNCQLSYTWPLSSPSAKPWKIVTMDSIKGHLTLRQLLTPKHLINSMNQPPTHHAGFYIARKDPVFHSN